MSKMSRIGITLCGAALLLAASAFAGDTNKGTLRLDEKVTIAGTSLDPGNYKVEWNGNGPDVQVNVLKGHETVATFPAHLQQEANPMRSDGYGSADQPNGGKTLTAIYFGGKHYALQVEPSTAQQQSGNNPGPSK
jgi:hypothetical protein